MAYEVDIDNPASDFKRIDSLFKDYKGGDPSEIVGKNIKPEAAILHEDSMPVIIKGSEKGGLNGYNTSPPDWGPPETTTDIDQEPPSLLSDKGHLEIEWSLYPNPAEEQITLHADQEFNFQRTTLIITDMSGRKVMEASPHKSGNELVIKLPDYWETGVYFLSLINDSGGALTYKRFIIGC